MQSSSDNFDPVEDMQFNPLSYSHRPSNNESRGDDVGVHTTLNTIYSELMNLKMSHSITDRRVQSLIKDVKEISELIKTIKVSSESKSTTLYRKP